METRAAQRGHERLAAGPVHLALLRGVRVVGVGGGRGRLDGAGTIIPACLATPSRRSTSAGSPPRNRTGSPPCWNAWTTSARSAGRCGRDRTRRRPAARARGGPLQAGVALVADHDGAARLGPLGDLAQMVQPEHAPLGLAGEFSQSRSGPMGPKPTVESPRCGIAPAMSAPTLHRSGRRVRETDDAPQPEHGRQPGDQFLVPITGRIAAGSIVTPRDRESHTAISPRSSSGPCVVGYPGASAPARSASWTISGVGSTGVPTEMSTMPSACSAARAWPPPASPRGSQAGT